MIRKRRKIINGIEIVLMEKVAQTATTSISSTAPVNEDLRTYIDEQIVKLKDEQETVVTQTIQNLPASILPTASTTVVTQEDLLSIVENTPEDGNYIIYDSNLGSLRWEQSPNVTTELLVTEIENNITRISTDGLDTDHVKANYLQLDFEDRVASKGIFWADPWQSSLYEGFSIQMSTDNSVYNEVNPLSGYNYGYVQQLAMRFTSGGEITTNGLRRGWVWTSVGPPSYGNGGYMPVMSLDRRGRMTLKSGITFEEYDGEGSFLSFSGAGGNTTPLSGYHNYVMTYNKVQHGMILADSGDVVVPALFVSGHDTWFGFDSSVIPPADPITLNFGPSPGPFGSIALISGAGGGGLHFQISRPTRIGYGATDYPLSAGQYFCGTTDLADIIDGVAGGALSINDLLDVDTGGTTDGMALVYCGASETWCGVTIAGGPGGGISPGDSTNLDALTCTTLNITGTTDPVLSAGGADFRGGVSGTNFTVNAHGVDGNDSRIWFYANDGGTTGANITWQRGSKSFSIDADDGAGGFNVGMQLAALEDLYVGTTSSGYGHAFWYDGATAKTIIAADAFYVVEIEDSVLSGSGGGSLHTKGYIASDGNISAIGDLTVNLGGGEDPTNFNEYGYIYFGTAGTPSPSYSRDFEWLRCATGGTGFEFSHDLYVSGSLKSTGQITGNSMSAANSIIAGTILQSQGAVYVNSTRTNATYSNLYFHDGSSPSNDYLRLRQSDDTFEFSNDVEASSFMANGSLSGINLWVNPNGVDGTDSRIWFYNGAEANDCNLDYNITVSAFTLAGSRAREFDVDMDLVGLEDVYAIRELRILESQTRYLDDLPVSTGTAIGQGSGWWMDPESMGLPAGTGMKDYTLFYDEDKNRYHIIGINSTTDPIAVSGAQAANVFVWGTSPNLSGRTFSAHTGLNQIASGYISSLSGTVDGYRVDAIWAPHLIKNNGKYYMFFTGVEDPLIGEEIDESNKQRIFVAMSNDVDDWSRGNIDIKFLFDGSILPESTWGVSGQWSGDCRDPWIIKQDDSWVMLYSTRLYSGHAGTPSFPDVNPMAIGVVSSTSLTSGWSNCGWIRATASADTAGGESDWSGTAESSKVIEYNNNYWLATSWGSSFWAGAIRFYSGANLLDTGATAWDRVTDIDEVADGVNGFAAELTPHPHMANHWIFPRITTGSPAAGTPHRIDFNNTITFTGSGIGHISLTGHDAMTQAYSTSATSYYRSVNEHFIDQELHVTPNTIIPSNQIGIGTFRDGDYTFPAGLNVEGVINAAVVSGALLYSSGDIYVNSNGPEGNGYIYFYDSTSQTGEYIQWLDSADEFFVSDDLRVNGAIKANTDLYVNYDGPNADSFIYFYNATKTNDAFIKWDNFEQGFYINKSLTGDGQFWWYDTGTGDTFSVQAWVQDGTGGNPDALIWKVQEIMSASSDGFYCLEIATGGSNAISLHTLGSFVSDTEIVAGSNIYVNNYNQTTEGKIYFHNGSVGNNVNFYFDTGASEFRASEPIKTPNIQSKSITVPLPTSSENIPMFYVTEDMYFIDAVSVVKGTGTPSVTYQVATGSSIASVTNIISNTTTNATTGDIDSIAGEAVEAGNWVVFKTTATGGTSVDLIHVTLTYSGVA